jgi:hypothetical protein
MIPISRISGLTLELLVIRAVDVKKLICENPQKNIRDRDAALA